MRTNDIELMAHLMRRAGFGADYPTLQALAAKGYDAVVEELLDPDVPDEVPEDLLRRYHPDQSGMMGMSGAPAYWLYRMIHTRAPLVEKMALFWHGVFATGYPKLAQGRVMMDQIVMFRRMGMGSFRTLLVELSMNPSMIIWLDNQDNHNGAINENYGRELLELFSMGVGNYSEDDIKECARAFTGWTVANTEYMEMRAVKDSIWPYGRLNLHFEYRPEDHDDKDKTFLGQTGCFNGQDIIDIICHQPATARFIARHLYNFFVADEPPVPSWPTTPPHDPEAIDILSQAYFESNYDLRAMLRTLFTSDFFRARECRYRKVKSPAELVAGVLRLTREYGRPSPVIQQMSNAMSFMGQALINPPSVEGWHEGTEWIDTGTLVERLNFASGMFVDRDKPGVKAMIGRLLSGNGQSVSPEQLVQGCIDQLGAVQVSDATRTNLVKHAARGGALSRSDDEAAQRAGEMLQMVAATPEFQRE